MDRHVCDHLRPVEDYLAARKCAITSAGQAWSSNCRFWITSQVLLDCIEIHSNDDPRSGREKGLVCAMDHDAIIGRQGGHAHRLRGR